MSLFRTHSVIASPARIGLILLISVTLAPNVVAEESPAEPEGLQQNVADGLDVDQSAKPTEPSPPVSTPLPYEVIEFSRGETFNLFAMGKKVWSDTGLAVRVYVLPTRHPLHKKFAKQKIGSFPHVLNAIWDRYVYSGSGQRPNQVKDEQEMLEAISSVEGAVGYLPDPENPGQVILVRNK
jgi:hypothetical protein